MTKVDLFQCLKSFVESSIVILKEDIDTIVRIRDNKLTHDSKYFGFDVTKTDHFIKSDYLFISKFINYLVYSNAKNLVSLDEYAKCVDLIKHEKKFDRLFEYNSLVILNCHVRISYEYFILYILEKALVYYILNNAIDIQGITKHSLAFCNLASNGIDRIYKISPLKGFFTDDESVSSIPFSETLRIRKVTNEEKMTLYTKGISENIFPYDTQWIVEYNLAVDNKIKDSGIVDYRTQPIDRTDAIFYAVISTLRLFQTGSIGLNSIITLTNIELPFNPIPLTGLEISGMDSAHSYYMMKKDNITDLKEFWKNYNEILIEAYPYILSKPDKFKNIKNAIERFNFANQHELGEPSVLDFVICLEALLTGKGDGRGEVAFRVARRYSRLVKRTPEERRDIFKKIKIYYDFRSSMAHGERNISGFNLIEIHSHVGTGIVKYLDLIKYRDHNQILEILDHS